ncbi:hypothetical protein H310_09431 [Aphanomyces invadans]|uniref:Pentacotripeptide-repeat region of PRORP domain-containing protein n=1 Tax=Aphanomyces invadans TaxID=157072 RepID=A0A024TVZ6_9STRA|nr:hypothetical protein H310_09431 [Aphanomyces invadans]ETV97512.1 hypothetical protein H310_09431 [Aphanomyces invadans]|eukprot:XP_008873721.1 hypothetical protein H310_09431 [Aphanomyces invadans]
MLRHAVRRASQEVVRRPTALAAVHGATSRSVDSLVLQRAYTPLRRMPAWLHRNGIGVRGFASHHTPDEQVERLSFSEVRKLGSTNKDELMNSRGNPAFFTLVKSLKSTWRDFYAHNPSPTAIELKTFFNAGRALDMDTVLVETVMAMHKMYPKEIKARHFMESRVSFLRLRKFNEMLAIYDAEKIAHPHPQPIFYIWALTASIEQNNLGKVKALLAEMKHEGYMVPNETVSRLLFNLAKKGDKATILEILSDLDPNVGIWTIPALNRTLVSLGMVGLPQEAFKFYGESSMDLVASTFKTVLEIAVRNECKKEAADILHNRKLFDLTLDTPEYNIILEALILLDRTDEMPTIVAEMNAAGVPTNAKSNHLLSTKALERVYLHSRHQPKSKLDGDLRRYLDKKQWENAARAADAILAENSTPRTIPQVLEAFLATNQVAKIDAVVASMQTAKWPMPPLSAIMLLLKQYTRREVNPIDGKAQLVDVHRAFEVYKAAKVQNITIFQPKMLYPVVLQLGEWEAAVDLFQGSLRVDADNSAHVPIRTTKGMRMEAFHDVVRVCAKMRQYKAMIDVVDMMTSHGHDVSPTVFKSMWFDPVRYSFYGLDSVNEKSRSDLMARFASAIVTCLRMIRSRQPAFQPDYTMVDSLANVLFYGKQRGALLEIYRQARSDPRKFPLPELTYQKLLQVSAVNSHNLAETKELYDEAIANYPNGKKSHGSFEGSLVRATAQAGHLDEMLTLLRLHPLGGSFRNALEVLFTQGQFDQAKEVLDMMLDAGFAPNSKVMLKAMSALASHSRDSRAPDLTMTFLDAFESSIVVNGQIQTKAAATSYNTQRNVSVSMRDIRFIYSLAVRTLEEAGDVDAKNTLVARMDALGIQPVAVDAKLKG